MNWTCPFCQRDQFVTDSQRTHFTNRLPLESNKFGDCGIVVSGIACSNKACGEVTLVLAFGAVAYNGRTGGYDLVSDNAESFRLRPASLAKPQPDCVPEVLACDYYEACAIRDLSP